MDDDEVKGSNKIIIPVTQDIKLFRGIKLRPLLVLTIYFHKKSEKLLSLFFANFTYG